MTILEFPPVDAADEHGLLAIGGDLEVDSLLLAYRSGIFPWPINEEFLTWFAPPERAVIECATFHVPRSLKKERRQGWASFAIDTAFEVVIDACRAPVNRVGQHGTWITDDIRDGFVGLHQAGHAHSFECYRGTEVVGGVYGVCVDGMFAAESMFYRYPNASKLTLWFLVEYLKRHQIPWLDVQVLTPFLAGFGALEEPRSAFMARLKSRLRMNSTAFSERDAPSLAAAMPGWHIHTVDAAI
jgi:leucyl/phenylalanyl-tRNA--protein transferase